MIRSKLLHKIITTKRFAVNSIRPSSSSNLDLDKLEADSSTDIEG